MKARRTLSGLWCSTLAACASSFPPHPGTIVFHTPGQHDRIEQAADVPDAVKFVLYDRSGAETADPAQAVRRVPTVEIDMQREPTSGRVEIFLYGPGHSFLKVTSGGS